MLQRLAGQGLKKEVGVLLFLTLLVIAAFFHPLWYGGLFFDTDATLEDYPLYSFYGEALREGTSFWWNPLYVMGYPSYLSAAFNMLDPVNLALFRGLGDPLTAHTVRVVIDAVLSVLLSYWFGRVTGLARLPAALLGLSYLMGFSLQHTTQNLMGIGSTFVLPGLLLLVHELHRTDRAIRWIILGGLFWGFSWLHAFANYTFNFSIVAGLYALYLDLLYPRISGWSFQRFRTVRSVISAGIIGVIIGLPFILPAALFRPLTRRVAGFGLSDLDGISFADPLNFFFPDYVRVPMLSSSGALYGFYIGGLALVLLGIGFIAMRWKERLWYGGMYLLMLSLAIKPLGLSWVLLHVPAFSYFHTMRRWLLAGIFFLAYAGAYGLHALLFDESLPARPAVRRYLFGAGCVIGMVLLGAVVLNFFFWLLPWGDPVWHTAVFQKISRFISISGSYPEAHYVALLARMLGEIRNTFSLFDWIFTVPFLLLLLSFAVITLFFLGRISRNFFIRSVIILVTINFTAYYWAQARFLVERDEYRDPPQLAEYLLSQEADASQYRLVSFLTGDAAFKTIRIGKILTNTEDYAISKEMLSPNANMFFGIPRADGYEPFWTRRQSYIWREFVRNEDPNGNPVSQAGQFVRWLPLLSAYNVKYILSGYPLEHPALSEAPFSLDRFPQLGLRLYINNGVRPRVSVSSFARVVHQWDDAYFDLYREKSGVTDVIECSACDETIAVGDAKIQDVRYMQGTVEFRVSAARSSWIVVAESHLPGWVAEIDTKKVPIRTANYTTQAVFVPAGEHSVRLSYRGIVWEQLEHYGW